MSKHSSSMAIVSALLALHGCGSVHRDRSDADVDDADGGRKHADGDRMPSGRPDADSHSHKGIEDPNTGLGCDLKVPRIVLTTREGDQMGVSGSFCASNDKAGCGVCGDAAAPPKPKQFTIVRASADAIIRVIGGVIAKPDRVTCVPDCPPQMHIVQLDCGTHLDETRTFAGGDSWQVDLSPGTYAITIDANFVGDEGTDGQFSVALGLIVDDTRDPAIIDADSDAAGSCSHDSLASCADRSAAAQALVQAALSQSTLECSEDADCMVVWTNTRCSPGCSSLTNRAGAAAFARAIEESESICGPMGECPSEQLPCPQPPAADLASCVSGTCMSVPPAGWAAFSLVRQTGTPGTYSTPLKCAADDCVLWKVTPNAQIRAQKMGQSTTMQLSSADFATVDSALRSAELSRFGATGNGIACDSPPSDQEVAISIQRGGVLTGRDVTGCALTGPAGNVYQQLYDVVRKY